MELWFVFATLGEMNLGEILAECQKQGWAPILIAKTENQTIVPCFRIQENAIKFAKRNLPKNQLFGTTILTDDDLNKLKSEWIVERGWHLDCMDHPRLMRNIATFNVEIFEYHNKPDVYGTWGSRCQNSRIISND